MSSPRDLLINNPIDVGKVAKKATVLHACDVTSPTHAVLQKKPMPSLFLSLSLYDFPFPMPLPVKKLQTKIVP